ncbi:MAG: Rab family GTPase [Candidatus Thorarchaeota archaeon]
MGVPAYKVILVGDPSVGKSSLIRRVLLDEFDETYCATVGVDLSAVAVNIDENTPVIITAIDLGGQEDFTALRTQYYKGSHAALLVFDVTRPESFERLSMWYSGLVGTVKTIEGREITGFVVGNKIDMGDSRAVSREDALIFADRIGWPYVETSAKTGENVRSLFERVAKILFVRHPPLHRRDAG